MSTLQITADLPTPDHEAGLVFVTEKFNQDNPEASVTPEEYLTRTINVAIASYAEQALAAQTEVLSEDFRKADPTKRMAVTDIFKAQAQPAGVEKR